MSKHYKISTNQALPDWEETYEMLLKGLRERRPALQQVFRVHWPPAPPARQDADTHSIVAWEAEIDIYLKAIAKILLRFLNACAAVPDRPKGYLKQALRSIGSKPHKVLAALEELPAEVVARIGDHYAGRSKRFATQWNNFELGQGTLDLARVKVAIQRALRDLEREPRYDKRGGPVFQELPRLLATALARVLGHWGIRIGRKVHEDGYEEGNLKTLIEIVKPLIDAQYRELTGHALSANTMVRYAIGMRKIVRRLRKRTYRGGSEADGNWPFSLDSVDAPVGGRGQDPHNLRPSNSLMSQKRDEISQRFMERRKALKVK